MLQISVTPNLLHIFSLYMQQLFKTREQEEKTSLLWNGELPFAEQATFKIS